MPQKPKKAKTAPVGDKPRRKGASSAPIEINAIQVETLKDLRKATRHTQEDLAIALGVGQGTISRIEKRNDMLVSTLQHYIESVGGTLHILATFPNRSPLIVEHLGEKAVSQPKNHFAKSIGSSRQPVS
ncbi:helix-turn-helix domain-containing protein [Eoetvoesiella caeni]|uniref:Helix-turn-helix protein n=1 Tax=Eoetvoesiella caeni TaxID=645616 RepID=A0A366H376_9BURK|nr:helix-turn-helix transcriptional regulator [Eoetvoesiella caeni]MCI2810654.1 helix-turn-helix domain-containing protein [Eoetvoesiella caeni]NYT56562.1 helix-turn-helix domain-containing protein [Eoetvoesiella caeni]RBP36277.1 helix-turn-helix protein [Eoetvoesiella caeni]